MVFTALASIISVALKFSNELYLFAERRVPTQNLDCLTSLSFHKEKLNLSSKHRIKNLMMNFEFLTILRTRLCLLCWLVYPLWSPSASLLQYGKLWSIMTCWGQFNCDFTYLEKEYSSHFGFACMWTSYAGRWIQHDGIRVAKIKIQNQMTKNGISALGMKRHIIAVKGIALVDKDKGLG